MFPLVAVVVEEVQVMVMVPMFLQIVSGNQRLRILQCTSLHRLPRPSLVVQVLVTTLRISYLLLGQLMWSASGPP